LVDILFISLPDCPDLKAPASRFPNPLFEKTADPDGQTYGGFAVGRKFQISKAPTQPPPHSAVDIELASMSA
jgi:hypothetical protein